VHKPGSSSTTRILIWPDSRGILSLASGSVSVNTAPPPGALAARKSPPCATAICCAIHNPSPLPSGFVVKYGSKISPKFSAGMPGPVSCHAQQ
jgi:hypothetical protein